MSDPSFRLQPGLRRQYFRLQRSAARVSDAYLRAGVAGAYLPRVRLDLPHLAQEHVAGSVPTCAAMVLQYHGVQMDPSHLSLILGTDDLYGTPGRRLEALKPWGIQSHSPKALQVFRDGTLELNQRLANDRARVVFQWEEAWLRYVKAALRKGHPPILFVDLGRLGTAWRGLAQPHAVVLAGGDGRQAWIHDPSRSYGPVRVGLGTLMDALLPGEPLAAVLQPDSLVCSLDASGPEGEG